MKNKELDEVLFKCANCPKKYLGKYISNKWESIPICDWCVLAMMLKESDHSSSKKITITSFTLGENGVVEESLRTKTVQCRPLPNLPSEVN